MLAGASVYVAPQTGGESFGIVLVEAMSARTAVVASDIPAFRAVLEDGRAGALFETGNSQPRYSETGFKRKPIYNSKPQGFDHRKET